MHLVVAQQRQEVTQRSDDQAEEHEVDGQISTEQVRLCEWESKSSERNTTPPSTGSTAPVFVLLFCFSSF